MQAIQPDIPDKIQALEKKQRETTSQLQLLQRTGRRGIQPDMSRVRSLRRGYTRREAILQAWNTDHTTTN